MTDDVLVLAFRRGEFLGTVDDRDAFLLRDALDHGAFGGDENLVGQGGELGGADRVANYGDAKDRDHVLVVDRGVAALRGDDDCVFHGEMAAEISPRFRVQSREKLGRPPDRDKSELKWKAATPRRRR